MSDALTLFLFDDLLLPRPREIRIKARTLGPEILQHLQRHHGPALTETATYVFCPARNDDDDSEDGCLADD